MDKAKEYFSRSSRHGNPFGQKMLDSMNGKSIPVGRNIYSSSGMAEIRRGFRLLEGELMRQYEHGRNLAEAEELQREIEERGEEI